MNKATVAILATALVLAGCLGGTTPEPEAPDGATEANVQALPNPPGALPLTRLTAEDLRQGRIHLEQPDTGWTSLHVPLTPDLWVGRWSEDGGQVTFPLVLQINATNATAPYFGLGLLRQPASGDQEPISLIQFMALPQETEDPVPLVVTHACQNRGGCGSAPPQDELVLLFGTQAGTLSVDLGLAEQDARMQELQVPQRPRLQVRLDHRGVDGFAGTFSQRIAPDGSAQGFHAGNLVVDASRTLEGPAGVQLEHTLRVQGEAPLTVPGAAGLTAVYGEAFGASEHNLSWALGDHSRSLGGLWLEAGSEQTGTQAPATLAAIETAPGQAHLLLERTFTGRRAPVDTGPTGQALGSQVVLVTWGWVGAEISQLYGWPAPAIVLPGQDGQGPPSLEGFSAVSCPAWLPTGCLDLASGALLGPRETPLSPTG